MDCLNNLVGIWDGCSTREDKLYINDLQGFDMNWLDSLAKEQNSTSIEVLESIRNKSGIFLKNEIHAFLNPRAELGSVLSNEVAGYIQDNKTVKTLEAAKYKGVQVTLREFPYMSIYVDRISLFAVDSVTTDIKVYDILQGILLDTLPITTVGGQVTTIDVGKIYQNKGQYLSLAFVIDSSVTDVYYVTATGRSCGNCHPRYEMYGYAGGRGIEFAQSATPLENTINGLGHTNGLSVHYSVQCDHDYWICNMAGRFSLAMYYRFGVELCEEILSSMNLNSLTTVYSERIKATQEKCIKGYNEQMEIVVKNLKIPNNICYTCTPLIKNNTRTP
jgi:hypothetical protein